MNWPAFVSPRGAKTLDALRDFAVAARDWRDDGPALSVATRDLVRELGFGERNEIALIADILIKEIVVESKR